VKLGNIWYEYANEQKNIVTVFVEVINDEDRREVAVVDVEYRMGMWVNPKVPGEFKDFYGCQVYVRPMTMVIHDVDWWCRLCTNARTATETCNVVPAIAILEPGETKTLFFNVALDGDEVPPPPWKDADGPYVRLVIYLRRGEPQLSRPLESKSLTVKFGLAPFKYSKAVSGYTTVDVNIEKIENGVVKLNLVLTPHGDLKFVNNMYVYIRKVYQSYREAVIPIVPAIPGTGGGYYGSRIDALHDHILISAGDYWGPYLVAKTVNVPVDLIFLQPDTTEYVLHICGVEVTTVGKKQILRPVHCQEVKLTVPGKVWNPPKKIIAPTQAKLPKGAVIQHDGDIVVFRLDEAPPGGEVNVNGKTVQPGKSVAFHDRGSFTLKPLFPGTYRYTVTIGSSTPVAHIGNREIIIPFDLWTKTETFETKFTTDIPWAIITSVDLPDLAQPGEVDIGLHCTNYGTEGTVAVYGDNFSYGMKGREEPRIFAYNPYKKKWEWMTIEDYLTVGQWLDLKHVKQGQSFDLTVRLKIPSDVTNISGMLYVVSVLEKSYVKTDKFYFNIVVGKERKLQLQFNIEPRVLVPGYGASLHYKIQAEPPFPYPAQITLRAYLHVNGKTAKIFEHTDTMVDIYDKYFDVQIPDLHLPPGKYDGKVTGEVEADGYKIKLHTKIHYT